MRVEKSGRKWMVSGQGDEWVLKKEYPTKWKAELALRVWKEGGAGFRLLGSRTKGKGEKV